METDSNCASSQAQSACLTAPDLTVGQYIIKACNLGAKSLREAGDVYSFDTAQTKCPIGYHVPSAEEWSGVLSVLDLNPL